MKVCDRHPRQRAVRTIYGFGEGQEVDLCDECAKDLRSFCVDAKVTIKRPAAERKKKKSGGESGEK
jgi:hypothetical protein